MVAAVMSASAAIGTGFLKFEWPAPEDRYVYPVVVHPTVHQRQFLPITVMRAFLAGWMGLRLLRTENGG